MERLNLIGVTTKSVQNALSVTPYGKTSIMELTLLWPDSEEGVQIMNAVMDILPGAIRNVLNIGDINRIEGPIVTTIAAPVGKRSIYLFPVLGLLGGLMYCFAQMYMHPTLIDIKDVGDMFEVNTLSVIDEDPSYEEFLRENLITNRQQMSTLIKDDYTTFAHILLHQIDDDYFSLFVTSSVHGEGKTTVIANLGIALAALDKRVLLIDFDLTDPNLGSYFMNEVGYKHTINAVYFDDVSVDDALVCVSPNLYLLTASLDKRHITIDRFAKKLVSQLETEFDVVILDTPPLGENSETLYFNTVSPNALYVIRYDYASCDVIAENIEKLKKAGTSLLGAVINRVPTKASSLSVGSRAEPEPEEKEESLAGKLFQKLPFVRRKETGEKQARRGDGGQSAADSFDSDDDLIDSEDFAAILNNLRHAGDVPSEPAARMEAAMTGLPPRIPKTAPEPGDREAAAGKKPKASVRQRLLARKRVPAQNSPEEPGEPAIDQAEDEDARFARIFGTHVNHLDGSDDDRL